MDPEQIFEAIKADAAVAVADIASTDVESDVAATAFVAELRQLRERPPALAVASERLLLTFCARLAAQEAICDVIRLLAGRD